MADVLEQSEVDALLAAAASGSVEEEQLEAQVFTRLKRDPGSIEIKDYDFKRPERVSKDQMRALQTLHESFARNFGASLSGFLRTIVEVKVATCEQMTYSEFISGLPNPTSFNLIDSDGLEGQMCFEISPLIIYPIIDRLLGGTSQELFIPQRPMTLIETRLISNVTNRGLDALSEAWASIKPLTFKISASESNPQLVQIVPPNEVVIVVGFELKMSSRAGTMNLCIPYNVIEPVMEQLSAQNWFNSLKNQKSKELEKRLTGSLSRAPLLITGLLAESTITVQDLADMKPGDVISTERLANKPVVLCVEGERKFVAQIGQYRGKRALKILKALHIGERV
ncbi:MAG: flagellar motor switch protein FliM [Phycisphaerales bacterium]|nr:MAG: flagellar motor switch protein FliM [Phycisphaerales bacterium]